MRNKNLLILSTLLLVFSICFNTAWKSKPTPADRLITIKQAHISGLDALVSAAEDLDSKTKEANMESLRRDFLQLRLLYKSSEPLTAYFDPEFVKDYINGPPLKSLERHADDQITVLDPEGLQVLEETLFADDPDRLAIKDLSHKFATNIKALRDYQDKLLVTDRHVFEASRFQLVRVFTTGLSGFDSPSLSQVLEEQRVSLQSVKQLLSYYKPYIKEKTPGLEVNIDKTLTEAIEYLQENQDFDTFDRLEFLRTYINPLFPGILKAQTSLGIETYYETSPLYRKHPVNYYADNIFAEDFLDRTNYTRYSKEELNDDVVNLGKVLFFDPVLSQNNKRSCASCHDPKKAFTDGMKKSMAFNMTGTVERNSPTLINAVYADRFFYDLRVEVLDDQIEHVVIDHDEFRSSFLELIEKLATSEEYVAMFKKAFPHLENDPIKKYSISAALSAYVASLSRLNSPFDRYARGETNEIDADVVKGFNLFYGKAACGTCHFAPVFNGLVPPLYEESESEVLGVPASTDNSAIDPDPGRVAGRIKESSEIYQHAFKTPTVRNVKYTAPYMHNGVYNTLEEVMDFYNKGGGIGLGLEVNNQTLPEDPLDLTDEEQRLIITFMESLSDIDENPAIPGKLPAFAKNDDLNDRKIGGEY